MTLIVGALSAAALLTFLLHAVKRRPKHVNYHTYIRSQKWARRRARYFRRHAYCCTICGTDRRVELHHHTYQRLGRERDKDLVPLCGIHHKGVHAYHNSQGGSLSDATFAYIRRMRGKLRNR